MCDKCPKELCSSHSKFLYDSKYIHIHPPCFAGWFEVHSDNNAFQTRFKNFRTCISGALKWANLDLEDYIALLKIKELYVRQVPKRIV